MAIVGAAMSNKVRSAMTKAGVIKPVVSVGVNPEGASPATPTVNNAPAERMSPYLAAQQSWNERYGDLISRARHWRMVALLNGVATLIAVSGVVVMARQSRLVPFVVALNNLNRPIASGIASETITLDTRVVTAAISDFVTDWRSITTDWVFQTTKIQHVFAQIAQGSSAQTAISEWYQKDPPQARSQKGTTSVEVAAILATGDKTWEVTWKEIKRQPTGQIESEENFKGLFTVVVVPAATEEDARVNPLGVFVTTATWSRVF